MIYVRRVCERGMLTVDNFAMLVFGFLVCIELG
jgi:hypothetical protein